MNRRFEQDLELQRINQNGIQNQLGIPAEPTRLLNNQHYGSIDIQKRMQIDRDAINKQTLQRYAEQIKDNMQKFNVYPTKRYGTAIIKLLNDYQLEMDKLIIYEDDDAATIYINLSSQIHQNVDRINNYTYLY